MTGATVPDPSPPLRLLVVENSLADAELVLASLKHAGKALSCFKVVNSPASFEEELDQATYDVILTDHNLVTWTGMDVLESLQRSGRAIPLIVVTGSVGDETAVKYIQSGAADYVLKDHLGRLPTAIDNALRAKTARDHAAELKALVFRGKKEWELTFDAVPDPTLVIDDNCRIKRANVATRKAFGLTFAQIIGKPCYEVVHGKTTPLEICPHQSLLATGHSSEGDIEEPRLGKIFHSSTSPLLDPDGSVHGCVHVLRDVTEHRRAERALQESEEKYRLLFERNPQPMWVYDVASLRFLAVNQAAVDHYGYSRGEFLSMTLKDIRPAEDVAAMIHSVSRVNRGIARAGVWRHRTKDGRIIFVEITDCRIDFEGQHASLVLANDVTEQKRTERELLESEEKYRQLVENASYGIYRSTPEGKLLDVNPAFVAMLGYTSKEELLLVNLEADVYEDPGERKRILREYEDAARRVQAEVTFKRKDGSPIRVRMDGRAVRDADKKILYFEIIAEDVTRQRSLERQVQQAQKMEAVGRLAGGVAHDFNNLLGVIIGYCDLALEEITDERSRKRISEAKKAAQRAAELTRQLLAFSRKQVLEPRIIDLNVVIADIGTMLLRLLGEDIELVLSLNPTLGKAKADPTQIEQVIMNLAVNARDAMPNGGRLTIETANVTLDDNYSRERHLEVAAGEYVMLAVSDNGTGMDEATKARLFEPFFTTKELGKGTGLGLATVYGIVKQSGGYVWVYSELGKGTTFKVYLRRVHDAGRSPEPARTPRPLASGDETILLVEDSHSLRELNREMLASLGYVVLTAENGKEALKIAGEYKSHIHLLLTDVVMPGINGRELADRLVVMRPDVKIMYMSGYTDDVIVHHEILKQGVAFLQKPFSKEELAGRVRDVLRTRES